MNLDTWLSKLDPNQAGLTALVWVLIIVGLAFLWYKVWPWYTSVYFPAKLEQSKARHASQLRVEEEQTKTLVAIRDAVNELKVVAGQQVLLLQQHSMESRAQSDNVLDHVRTLIGHTLPIIEKEGKQ